jgi:hypothetical protein
MQGTLQLMDHSDCRFAEGESCSCTFRLKFALRGCAPAPARRGLVGGAGQDDPRRAIGVSKRTHVSIDGDGDDRLSVVVSERSANR